VDEELANAKVHLSLLSGIFDGVVELLDRLHMAAAAGVVYAAWPEIRGDVDELIKDVRVLCGKLRLLYE